MLKAINDIKMDERNIFLLWEGNYPKRDNLIQIQVCLKSIAVNEPEANVYLFSNVLKEGDLPHDGAALVRWSYSELAEQTDLDGTLPNARSDWRVWSDVFRVVCLWRWGGTYFDVDDIMVRPLPERKNVMAACFLTDAQHTSWLPNNSISDTYAASTGNLALPRHFRFGNDPMTNFDAHNSFLQKWLMEIPGTEPSSWGQVLPSQIFSSDPGWARNLINPIPWSDLLYHPYDGGHHPDDQRYPGIMISTHQMIGTESQSNDCFGKLLGAYGFYLVKNHDFNQQILASEPQQLLRWVVQGLFREHGSGDALYQR